MTAKTAISLPPDFFSVAGIGLKNQHMADILHTKPAIGFLEVHAENFMSVGGNHLRFLDRLCEGYPLSVHGVGMSLGSAEGLSKKHLKAFKAVLERFQPVMVSEHLAWSVQGGYYLNDLLPVPLTEESLGVVSRNIETLQDFIGRQIFIENPSAYMAFQAADYSEPDFLKALVQKTGCGLLLDINNVYVSAQNMGWDAVKYLNQIPAEAVGEIHLAGHLERQVDDQILRIDDHGSKVCEGVWALYEHALALWGAKPTLIEWDTNIPALDILLAEAMLATDRLTQVLHIEKRIGGDDA